MPTKVISTKQQFAASCKKYKGIVFMDKDGKDINDTNDLNMETNKSEPFNNNIEITSVDDFNT